MKILMIDKYYFIKGGAERYYFELKQLLENRGHEVIPFSMQHEDNFDNAYEDSFVDQIEFNGVTGLRKLLHMPKVAGRVMWSTQAQTRITDLIEKTKPDLAHLHMIDHQISPSILPVLKRFGLPVIQTVHQYKLVCPNYRMYIEQRDQVCERCLGGRYYHAVVQKCHKNALLPSILVSMESYFHRWLKVYDHIDLFHAPSAFIGRKLIEGGVDSDRVKHLFYAIDLQDYEPVTAPGDYLLYFGRLSGEKGLFTLLKAMKKLPACHLKIVGDGPLRPDLEEFVQQHQLSNVEFIGARHGQALKDIVAGAAVTIVPSEWYENSPLVIYESFALGTPVIGARIGGIPELIDDQENGLLFTAGDSSQLADQIDLFMSQEQLRTKLGKAARRKAELEFDVTSHYPKLMQIYDELVEQQLARVPA